VPDRTPPRVLHRHFRKSYGLASALAHGLVGSITSSEAGTASATATTSRSTAKRQKALKVAHGSARLKAGRAAQLRLKFTRAAKRRLAHATRVALTIRITVKDAAGNATRVTVKATLKG
jgi:hypothetical protein